MESRRQFLRNSVLTCASLAVMPGVVKARPELTTAAFKNKSPKTALVFWYSQTGHTERYGKAIAQTLRAAGLDVDAVEIGSVNIRRVDQYDLIVAGTPVHYGDVPRNVQKWLHTIKRIDGTAVAAYSTFGGPGDNQFNTSCALADLLVEKGGVPVGVDQFGNMSTFAPTWSMGNSKRILAYRHLPNEDTFSRVTAFAERALENLRAERVDRPEKEFTAAEMMRVLPTLWGTKLLIKKHVRNVEKCVECGACVRKCPVGAIELQQPIDTDACIACMGCVNNCPMAAIEMDFMGHQVIGFLSFLKQHDIEIMDPT